MPRLPAILASMSESDVLSVVWDIPAPSFVPVRLVVLPSTTALRLTKRLCGISLVFHVPPLGARMFLAVSTSFSISSAVILQSAVFLESLLLSATKMSCGLNPVECSLIFRRSHIQERTVSIKQ